MVSGTERIVVVTKEAEAMDIMLMALRDLFKKMEPNERVNFKYSLFEGYCEFCGLEMHGRFNVCLKCKREEK